MRKTSKYPVLEIKNFSCIKEMTVAFAHLVVLIGEQASGKSVTCKLYYFFTGAFHKVVVQSLVDGDGFDSFCGRVEKEFDSIFPATAWKDAAFSIKWRVGDVCLCVKNSPQSKRLRFSGTGIREKYERCRSEIAKKLEVGKACGRTGRLCTGSASFAGSFRVRELLHKVVDREFPDPHIVYVPAGRSFFSVIQSSVFSLLANDIGIDYFLKLFGQFLERARRCYNYRDAAENRVFDESCRSILHGKYEDDGKDQWIVADGARKVRLADASSGQQEALPLLMTLAQFSKRMSWYTSASVRIIIEEPEAHLYPVAQQQIVDFLADNVLANKNCGGIITTHSPFILCCINNALKRLKYKKGEVVACHVHDGTCDPIFDAEYGMINAERFDRISEDIANA